MKSFIFKDFKATGVFILLLASVIVGMYLTIESIPLFLRYAVAFTYCLIVGKLFMQKRKSLYKLED